MITATCSQLSIHRHLARTEVVLRSTWLSSIWKAARTFNDLFRESSSLPARPLPTGAYARADGLTTPIDEVFNRLGEELLRMLEAIAIEDASTLHWIMLTDATGTALTSVDDQPIPDEVLAS